MKKWILLIAAIVLASTGLVQAQESQLKGTLDVTYLTSYIWRGFDMYGESRGALQPSLDLDLYGTGLGLKILMSKADASGRVNAEELDYTLYYKNSLYQAEAYATDYMVGWTYYSYPDNPRNARNMQEIFVSVSMPKICPAGIVPSYTYVYSWPAEGDSALANSSEGSLHIFGLGYDLTVVDLIPEIPEQTFHLSAAAVYNDGAWDFANPTAGASKVDHDWSHAVFGISTDFELASSLTLTPAVYYQASMDDSVNTEDETWCGISLRYAF